MEKEKTKVKPCPFCGGEPITKTFEQGVKIICSNNECVGSYIYKWYKTEEEAKEAWERRV